MTMNKTFQNSITRWLAVFSVAVLLVSSVGCQAVTLAAYLINGTDIPAEFEGLQEKKVCVICRPITSIMYTDSLVARDLADQVGDLLRTNVKQVNVIDSDKVDAWCDSNEWTDFAEVGQALGADMVVGIDLLSFSLLEGQTLYQGKSQLGFKVIDCTSGGDKIVFEKEDMPPIVYPPNSAIESISTSEKQFRKKYLKVVSDAVGRYFYPHDAYADFALDATAID